MKVLNTNRRAKIQAITEFLKQNSTEFNLMFCSSQYIAANLRYNLRITQYILKLMVQKKIVHFKIDRERHPKRYPVKLYYFKSNPP